MRSGAWSRCKSKGLLAHVNVVVGDGFLLYTSTSKYAKFENDDAHMHIQSDLEVQQPHHALRDLKLRFDEQLVGELPRTVGRGRLSETFRGKSGQVRFKKICKTLSYNRMEVPNDEFSGFHKLERSTLNL